MFLPWKYLQRGLPILEWSKGYNIDKAISDIVAGITVGLTLIPQSLAYASLAGLEPQYGLYSSLCGGLIYLFFGTISELSIAPTALLSLLTYSYTKHVSFGNVPAAILLCFLAGCIELLCGLLHLGFLVEFVSTPVVAGFTSAGAMTIASSQVKNLIGLKFDAENFFDIWKNVFEHITEYNKWDTLLGLGCCVILLLMRKLKDYGAPLVQQKGKEKQALSKKLIWMLSVGRNALIVLSCATAAFFLEKSGDKPFSLTAKVPSGWPEIKPPPFQIQHGNTTFTFIDMVKELKTDIIVIPFIAIVANVGIAKAFAHGKLIDATQEMIALGLCNIAGSFFGSYPVNASFSRAAVGGASGVRTPLAGVYTAAIVILAFSFLTPYFSYIPKPTLAAVIICAVVFMIEVTLTTRIWIISKVDLIPFFVTLLSCLIIGIELGILIGIVTDILKLLYMSARPKVVQQRCLIENTHQMQMKFTPTTSVLFTSAEYIRKTILQQSINKDKCRYIIINFERVETLDFTASQCIGDLVKDLKGHGKQVLFLKVNDSWKPALQEICGKDLKMFPSESELQNYLLEQPLEDNGNLNSVIIINNIKNVGSHHDTTNL